VISKFTLPDDGRLKEVETYTCHCNYSTGLCSLHVVTAETVNGAL